MIPAFVGHRSISFKRLRSTSLDAKNYNGNSINTKRLFFLSFFLFFGKGVGEHAKGRVVTLCKGIQDSLGFCIPRPGFCIPGTGFRSLLAKFGFWIPVISRILDSLSCILDSKAQDSRFHNKKFPGVRNPDFLDMEREEKKPAVNALVFPFSTISGSA